MRGAKTSVTLLHLPNQHHVYLRFGRRARGWFIDGKLRIAEFAPGSVFCRVRWEGNAYGTTLWQLAVLQALSRGESVQRIAGVVPGAALLLRANGAGKVQAVLRLIDTIEAQRIDPADVAVRYWRTVHNRLAAHVDVVPYTQDRHAAYLAGRALA